MEFTNLDCRGPLRSGFPRIFIAYRTDGKSGQGTASDPFNGSSEQEFDALLRTRSESGLINLVVCIGSGRFRTDGQYDYAPGAGHRDKSRPRGFTVNRGWKVHGAGENKTVLELASLYSDEMVKDFIVGRIITTHDLDSEGVEVSDLTLDDNYPELKVHYRRNLQLEAVVLRANRGKHWIHHIHVLNAAGEFTEAFPVEISSQAKTPFESTGNIVEYVTMDHWGSGKCTAIAIDNAEAEVRFNSVTGYQIAYGGWNMSDTSFHDNYALQTVYGFNIDSLRNSSVTIAQNRIIRPRSYGIVVGGVGQFIDFSILDNTIELEAADFRNVRFALVFQGGVHRAHVIGNQLTTTSGSSGRKSYGVYEKGTSNLENIFKYNVISDALANSLQGSDCVYGNVDQGREPLRDLYNTQPTACNAARLDGRQ